MTSRRTFLRHTSAASASALLGTLLRSPAAHAQSSKTLTIAYHTALPGLDPTNSPQTSNPAVQSIFKAIYDQYVEQNPDLTPMPGILTKWGWNAEKSGLVLTLRKDAYWHDGTPVTPEDLVWSLERAGDEKNTNPMQFTWKKLGNFKIDGHTVTAQMKEFEPAMLKWLLMLTAYIMPKHAYAAAGASKWDTQPIGSGPYRVDKFERDGFIRLKAFPKHWGPKPAFETVIFKFVPDASARVAEIESGASDLTLEVPYDEYDRLITKPALTGVVTPISDIGIIFLSNRAPMLDKNVRLAAAHAIDKQALVQRLLRGYGVPVDTMQAPQYDAYDASIRVAHDAALARELLAKSGYSPDEPVRFTIQTTRGYKPKDFEMIQAIAGMWRKVGIEASIEVIDVTRHFELRMRHELAPAAFYNWGNSAGDPSMSTGFAMFSQSPHSAWKGEDVDKLLGPLWVEKDEAKRIAGYKAADRYIAEQGYAIPLLQYAQPVVYKRSLKFAPHMGGFVLPQATRPV